MRTVLMGLIHIFCIFFLSIFHMPHIQMFFCPDAFQFYAFSSLNQEFYPLVFGFYHQSFLYCIYLEYDIAFSCEAKEV